MGDRRDFFTKVGTIAAVPWSNISSNREGANTRAGDPAGVAELSGIVLENAEMRLVIGENGQAKSLVHKATGQECLVKGANVPMFTVTQYRPYDNELQLAYITRSQFPGQTIQSGRLFRLAAGNVFFGAVDRSYCCTAGRNPVLDAYCTPRAKIVAPCGSPCKGSTTMYAALARK